MKESSQYKDICVEMNTHIAVIPRRKNKQTIYVNISLYVTIQKKNDIIKICKHNFISIME